MAKIYVIHENEAWVEPLRAAFSALDLPYEEWFINEDSLDLSTSPPEGVFYNRMSASSHTRGHRYAPELTAGILAWLESHGRRVINNGSALRLDGFRVTRAMAHEYLQRRRHFCGGPRSPNVPAFSCERQRAAEGRPTSSSAATPLREDRSAFHDVGDTREWSAGHAPAGDESATPSTRCSPTHVRTGGCTEARNESSGKAAPPALRIAFAGSRLRMSRPPTVREVLTCINRKRAPTLPSSASTGLIRSMTFVSKP